jgi:AcrR family transcriptional regulator
LALSAGRREDRRRHIVSVAQALLRDRGDGGFSMTELAARAGVSPATPYNLVGSKGDLLRLVIKAEFQSFIDKLSALDRSGPLRTLLDATTLVVSHYEADRDFYRALYRMTFNTDAPDVHDHMQAEGRALWQGLVRAAVDSGELTSIVRVEPFTDVLLRTLGAVTLAWLSEDWPHARFEREMALSVLLIVASAARPDIRSRLLDGLGEVQMLLAAH